MRKVYLKRLMATVLLLCTLLSMCVVSVSATDTDYMGIAVSKEHEKDLSSIFATPAGAAEYDQETHVVDLIVGTTLQLYAVKTSSVENGIVWESSDPTVATVTADGVLMTESEGQATITAASGTMRATILVNVCKSFTLTSSKVNMSINKLAELELAMNGDLTKYIYYSKWNSTNEYIAVVGSGLMLASKEGSGQIIANIYEIDGDDLVDVAACEIIVHPDIASVQIANKRTELELGKTMKLNVQTVPEKQNVIWVLSDESLATIENGILTATGVGNLTIYAYAGCWTYNKYEINPEVVSTLELEIWSDSTIKHAVEIPDKAKGEVTVDKTEALAGETVTIYTENVYENNGTEYEMFGASAISIVDANGMAVSAKSLGRGVFSFEMPKSAVKISAIYSSMYNVTYETAIKANFARDDVRVASITINEYVGGSFNGSFLFSENEISFSRAKCSHGIAIRNEDGSISIDVDDNRDIATKITIDLYANAQEVTNGSHTITAAGDMSLMLENSFVACNVGDINENSRVVTVNEVNNIVSDSVFPISTKDNIVIHGEALSVIKSKRIKLILELPEAKIILPYHSLNEIDVEEGDFTIFDIQKNTSTLIGDEKTIGTYTLIVHTYTGTGARKNQLSMIGESSIEIVTDVPGKLTLQTGLTTYTSDANGRFNFDSLLGIGSFVVSGTTAAFSVGDIIFTAIIVILIIGAFVALFFLLKRNGFIGKTPTPTPTAEEPDTGSIVDDDTDEFDDEEFKTVDDILKNANLGDEISVIRTDACNELVEEINLAGEELDLCSGDANIINKISDASAEIESPSENLFHILQEYKTLLTEFNESKYNLENDKHNGSEIINMPYDEVTSDTIHRATDKLRESIANCKLSRKQLENCFDEVVKAIAVDKQNQSELLESRESLLVILKMFGQRKTEIYDEYYQQVEFVLSETENIITNPDLKQIESEFGLIDKANLFIRTFTEAVEVAGKGTSLLKNRFSDKTDMDNTAVSVSDYIEKLDQLVAIGTSLSEDHKDFMKRCAEFIEKQQEDEANRLAAVEAAVSDARLDLSNSLTRLNEAQKEYLKQAENAESSIKAIEHNGKLKLCYSTIVDTVKDADVNFRSFVDNRNIVESNNEIYIEFKNDFNVEWIREVAVSVKTYSRILEDSTKDLINLQHQCDLICKQEQIVETRQTLLDSIQAGRELSDQTQKRIETIKGLEIVKSNIVSTEDLNCIMLAVEAGVETLDSHINDANEDVNKNDVDGSRLKAHIDEVNSYISNVQENTEIMEEELDRVLKEYDEFETRHATEIASKEEKKMNEMFALVAQRKGYEMQYESNDLIRHEKIRMAFEEHAKTVKYLRSLENPTEEHRVLQEYSDSVYRNVNELLVSGHFENNGEFDSDIADKIQADLDLEIHSRNILMTENQEATFGTPKFPKRKIEQLQAQMNAQNPYIS